MKLASVRIQPILLRFLNWLCQMELMWVPKMVTSESGVKACIEYIIQTRQYFEKEKRKWHLSVDLEGPNLSRHGTISLLAICVPLPMDESPVYLINTFKLGEKAFSSSASNGLMLKTILESQDISKLFFDVRCDSDALFAHYYVRLAGVTDLQLVSLVLSKFREDLLMSLTKCCEKNHVGMFWKDIEFDGRGERTARDVYCIILLWGCFRFSYPLLEPTYRELIDEETQARLNLAQAPVFDNMGPHMVLSPFNDGSLSERLRAVRERSALPTPPLTANDPTVHLNKTTLSVTPSLSHASTSTQPNDSSGGLEAAANEPTFSGFFRFGGTPNDNDQEDVDEEYGSNESDAQSILANVTIAESKDTVEAAPVVSRSGSKSTTTRKVRVPRQKRPRRHTSEKGPTSSESAPFQLSSICRTS